MLSSSFNSAYAKAALERERSLFDTNPGQLPKEILTRLQQIKPNSTYCHTEISPADIRLNQKFNSFVHITMDAQVAYADPNGPRGNADTDLTTDNIGHFSAALDTLGIPTIQLYFDKENEGPEKANGGFYKLQPQTNNPSHILIPKDKSSGFEGTCTLHAQLQSLQKENIILDGFNLTGCLYLTAIGALDRDYNLWIPADCTTNDNRSDLAGTTDWRNLLHRLKNRDAIITSAADIAHGMAALRRANLG